MSAETDLMAAYRDLATDQIALDAGLNAGTPAIPETPEFVDPVHRQTVALIHRLLNEAEMMGAKGPFGILMRTFRVMEPRVLEELTNVPPAQIVAFMHGLAAELNKVGALEALPSGE